MFRSALPLFVFTIFTSSQSFAQCNGFPELCDKRYDEVAYLTTHNAFNAGDEGFSFPDHNFGLTDQMEYGVRGLMLDVYDENGVATVYHSNAVLGSQPLSSNLAEIKDFLDANPTDIVTIIFECYIDANLMEQTFDNAGLLPYLHQQDLGTAWPTLQSMIDAGGRLVVLYDVDDAGPGQEWYHYVWDFAVETHFSNSSPSDFSCEFNRGDSINDLFILNHFITSIVGTGSEPDAQTVNAYDFFYPRAVQCMNEKQKFPNFPTIDFHEHGEPKRVVDSLNQVSSVAGVGVLDFQIQPTVSRIGDGQFQIQTNLTGHIRLSVVDVRGREVLNQSGQNSMFTIDLSQFPQGLYLVNLKSSRKAVSTLKLIR
jgi:hypothetical protein